MMKPFELRDLLPRAAVETDVSAMRSLVEGRNILVTGAGGSIGSELCRQLTRFGCASLLMFERHENSLHEVLLTVDEKIAHPFLGDILDERRLQQAFATSGPEIVFHAAAHKHVPLIEDHAGEAVKNNVTGTRLVAEAAARHGVERFVLISSDKAVHPSSVMGATKRVSELLMRDAARRSDTQFVTVRFGNVLGSSGSVVPRFLAQLRTGGPLTITHPDVNRFFLMPAEAVQLVIEAAALGHSDAVYVLEMGEPVRIVDLARRVIAFSGAPATTPIVFIGLRPGEKLCEELIGASERATATALPHMREIQSDAPLPATFSEDLALLEMLAVTGSDADVVEQLRVIVPEFVPAPAMAVRA